MSEKSPVTVGPARTAARGAGYAVAVLTAMNLLNYIDRYVPSAVKELLKGDLKLSDVETSYPLSAFILVYMVASPIFGHFAERGRRTRLIAFGVAFWSLASASSALATGVWSLLFTRALVGVGEAAYAVISPSLIADLYAPNRRNRILTFFYAAIPVGAALGFGLGGLLGKQLGWRAAFLVCGIPGVLVALLALTIEEPARGGYDLEPMTSSPPTFREALRALSQNRVFLVTLAGYIATTFATGGFADWFPTYLHRVRGIDLGRAGLIVGGITVVGGIVGTVTGGLLADKLRGVTRQPYLAACVIGMVPATVLCAVALHVEGEPAILGSILACQVCLWFYNGPVNTLLVSSVSVAIRARAFSLSILAIHVLGDVVSPPLIGAISDATGDLKRAVLVVPVALGVAAVIWLLGWRWLPESLPEAAAA